MKYTSPSAKAPTILNICNKKIAASGIQTINKILKISLILKIKLIPTNFTVVQIFSTLKRIDFLIASNTGISSIRIMVLVY